MSVQRVWLAIASVLVLLPSAAAVAQDSRCITVTGKAEVKVAPDEVILTLGVETRDRALAAAKDENDRRVAALRAAATGLGIERDQLAVDYLDIRPLPDPSRDPRSLGGYYVRRTVVITPGNLQSLDALLTAALEAGANHVQSVDFRTTRMNEYREQAREMALAAARTKAERMAGHLAMRIGAPLEITENAAGWPSPFGSGPGAYGPSMAGSNSVTSAGPRLPDLEGPTIPGQIAVTALVTVTFELIP